MKEEWVLECYVPWKTIAKLSYNEGGGSKAQQASKRIHRGVLVGVEGANPLKSFRRFTSGWWIIAKKKPWKTNLFWMQAQSEPIFTCFKIQIHEDWVSKLNYKIEFFLTSTRNQNSWINPWHWRIQIGFGTGQLVWNPYPNKRKNKHVKVISLNSRLSQCLI